MKSQAYLWVIEQKKRGRNQHYTVASGHARRGGARVWAEHNPPPPGSTYRLARYSRTQTYAL